MKKIFTIFMVLVGILTAYNNVHAESYYYQQYPTGNYGIPAPYHYNSYYNDSYVQELLQIIETLQQQLLVAQNQYAYSQYPTNYYNGYYDTYTYGYNNGYGYPYTSYNQEPSVDTQRARNVGETSAELNGEVDMNDFRNGTVFFVYGQDEDEIENVADDYDEYDDVEDDYDRDDFMSIEVDDDLDRDEDYEVTVRNLEPNEDYYFVLCVEYEDDNDDDVIVCGDVRDFETD